MKKMTRPITVVVATSVMLGGFLAAVFYGRRRWATGTKSIRSELEAGRVATDPKVFRLTDLVGLPAPVQRYFQAVLQDGQPIIAAASMQHEGRIDMGMSVPNWKPFTSKQRVIARRPGFDWDARVRMLPGVPVFIHDAYVAGRGRLQASVLGLFNMAEMRDSPDLRRGELMRFLRKRLGTQRHSCQFRACTGGPSTRTRRRPRSPTAM